jgi:long-chain acyl-CoA synthetase
MAYLWEKSYAPGVPVSLSYERTTVAEALERSTKEFPDKAALIFLDKVITYKKLNEMANQFGNWLILNGVKKGDKVAMLMPNIPQIVIASYGAWKIGAVVVMNNPLYTDRELEHQLNNSESSVLVTLDLLAPRMIALKPKTPVNKIVVAHIRDHLGFPKKQLLPIVAKDKHRDIPPTKDVVEWTDILKTSPSKDPGVKVEFDSLASLQYTGGTTGVSKGVMLSHSNLAYNVQQLRAWFPSFLKGELVWLGVLPYFHSFGLTCVMNYSIWMSGTQVLIPRPEPEVILEAVHKHKVNFFPAVPTMYVGLLNHPKLAKYDISSIKGCFSGAAPLPVEIIKAFEAKAGAQICEGFGLSETTPVVTINPWGAKTKPSSVGLPISDTLVRIVDLDEGVKELPTGTEGEVCIKGPQVMSGYYNMPDETSKVLKDGWLYTGDIGKFDDEGYLYIVDRKKDMIIAGGYNIYPRDIDEVLFEHPKILEACAIGVPDSYRGETVKAFVVMKPGEQMTAEEVISYCKEKLAKYKVPTSVEFIDTLPKSGVGKILRKELRAAELEKIKAAK